MVSLTGILGNGCDSSQHQRTSRTNSIQSMAIADQTQRGKVQEERKIDIEKTEGNHFFPYSSFSFSIFVLFNKNV